MGEGNNLEKSNRRKNEKSKTTNMKKINKIAAMVVAGLALATASCSDFDDYNSVPVDANAMSGKTLYENICETSNLQDFAAIVKKANYGNVLNASQCYTLWAPVDGSYDASKILAMDSAKIVDRFINMHMAQFSHPISGTVDERVITLNNKHHQFSNSAYDDLNIVTANIPSKNGIIHTINGASEYRASIYEALDEVEGCDSFVNHLHAYDIMYVDTRKSVEGPMVNGQQTYLDTVWAKRNNVIRQILRADIEDEDSTYTVLFPTNEAWNKAVENISPLYQYIGTVNYMDMEKNTTAAGSVTATTAKAENPSIIDQALYNDSLPKSFIMRNLAYSNSYDFNKILLTNSASEGDTIYSARGTKLTNVPELLQHCGEVRPMSNGYVRTLDDICFKPWETYNPIRGYAYPVRTLGLKSSASATQNLLGADSVRTKYAHIFEDLPGYIRNFILPEDATYFSYFSTDSINLSSTSSKPEMDFALRNVLSTKYKIYVVLVPSQLKEPWRPVSTATEENKNLYLRFDMSYTEADGSQKYKRLNVADAKKNTDDILVVNNGKIQVVELEFTFPICYSGLDAYPTLFMSHTKSFTSSTNRRKYEQELRVEGVYLVPEGANDYVQSLKF